MKLGKTRGYKKKADDLFSKIVRARGRCESCGSRENLQTAHIISRRYSNTRCLLENAFCLCAKDHLFYTANPVKFAYFVESKIGKDKYLELEMLSIKTTKVDWEEVYSGLLDVWKLLAGQDNQPGDVPGGI